MEGAKQEKKYFQSLERVFFTGMKLDIFILSGEENIYALWQQMKADEFDTDIIEVLREKSSSATKKLDGISRRDFQEVYLFYDYDPQQNNASGLCSCAVLLEMLKVFDNETENGRLYISYPMSEALRDVRENSCMPFTCCMLPLDDVSKYKQMTGVGNKYVHAGAYGVQEWRMILSIYFRRLKCLYGLDSVADILANEKELNSPLMIYEKQQVFARNLGKVFILSAFPEFLVDYFPAERVVGLAEVKIQCCDKYGIG